MKRPTALFKIHDTTPVHSRLPGSEVWQTYRIARKTGNSIFIETPDGLVQLDRRGPGAHRPGEAPGPLVRPSTSPVPTPRGKEDRVTSKKVVDALCGSAMIVTVALGRSFSDGGRELIALLIVGLVTLIGSADLPQSQKGRGQ